MKVFIDPPFRGPDRGEGGIRRIVEAQKRWLPLYGIEVVDDINNADIAAFHGGQWTNPPSGIPVVAHIHGLYWEEHYAGSRGHLAINKDVIRNLKQADATTAPSEWVAQAVRRGMWLDPTVLYHGIEPNEWTPHLDPSTYVLWNKTRVDQVCDPTPVNELAKRRPTVGFVSTFGDKSIQNIDLTGTLTYDNARELVRRAGVYLATARETMGIGTLEAMAAGVPVLGFNWGGQPEIIVHKEHGYLAEPGDYDDLALGLDYCIKHRAYLGGNATKQALENFTWEIWIKRYAELYRTVVLEARRRPKVSVIIPYYNLAAYVQEAVDSAIRETTGLKSEIIIVDDASSEPLPLSATPPAVHVLRNARNQDLPETLNIALRAATGEYVILLDADNRLVNLKTLVNALDADRSLDIAYGRMRVFSDNDKVGWVSSWPPHTATLEGQLAHKNQIPSTALCRSKIASWVGGYRHRCYTAEDADFWTRALAVGANAKCVTEEPTLEYRDRSDSRSHQRKDWAWNDWYKWAAGPNRLISVGGPVRIYDKPEVSIVIPVGPGHERYLADALDSVQAQSSSFWNWEAIVVNDTGKKLKTPPWAHVIPAGRRGASAARNRGTMLAKGKYVLYLDADDFLHPDALYHFVNYFNTSTCPRTFVFSDWYSVDTKEAIHIDPFNNVDVLGRLPFPVTCLYNRDALINNNIRWDESFDSGWEDWDFAIQVVTKGFCGLHLGAPLLHYRLHSGTLRAAAKSNADEIKRKIRFKYSDYFDRTKGKLVPGCGGCGGGRYPALMVNHSASVFDGVDVEKDTTLIEYNPPPDWTGTRSFVGRKTQNRYRFSPEAPNNVRRVFNDDVPGLVELGYFNVLSGAVGAVEPLQVPGPNNEVGAPA